jgi:predicted nucleic acid-binding protein
MTGEIFLDTNVVVYMFDADAPRKQRQARELFTYQSVRYLLSTQVLQEFYVSVTRKLATPLDAAAAYQAVQHLTSLRVIQIDPPLVLSAITRSRSAKLSFWDALIVESALAGGAVHLYSEDLQDGRMIEGMRITNPFKEMS